MSLLRRYDPLKLLGAFALLSIFFSLAGVMATTVSDVNSFFTGDIVFGGNRALFDEVNLWRNFDNRLGVQNTDTDTLTGVDIMPKGSPGGTTVQLNLFGTDFDADTLNFERLLLSYTGTEYIISANKGGTGTLRDLSIQAGGSTLMTFEGDASAVTMSTDIAAGGNDISGVGTITSTKSTSGAHDPPFKAPDGVTYTSYGMVSTVYQVRSSVMQGQLSDGELLLDFSSVAPGSELYRFYWEIDPDTLRVITQPLGNCIVSYGMPTLTTIRFYSTSWCTDQDAKFNFELSANRFDAAEWPSVYGDFGSPEPWWTQDSGEYTLGVADDESLRGIWKSDHPSKPVKEIMFLEGSE